MGWFALCKLHPTTVSVTQTEVAESLMLTPIGNRGRRFCLRMRDYEDVGES
jgi:hypothetical protein